VTNISNPVQHLLGLDCIVEMHDPTKEYQPAVRIDAERDTSNGWLYSICVQWADTNSSDHEITLSWVDHEHLVGGGVPPSNLIKCAAELAAKHFGPEKMPMRCDVSSLRRHIDDFDDLIRSMN
jgi:hypothetical protein